MIRGKESGSVFLGRPWALLFPLAWIPPIALLIASSGCSFYDVILQRDLQDALVQRILQDHMVLAMELLPVPWKELTILSPYSDPSSLPMPRKVRRALERTGIMMRDDICVLVFRIADDSFQIVVQSRDPVDFSHSSGLVRYRPNDCVRFRSSPDGIAAIDEAETVAPR